ncbi:MAG: NTP transferase domain-containing protein [Candidatus Sabulitectum sp.]|nr:NTP transferase domain-containing protein [Candidatus Sabulitectum sp.]
MKGVVLAGGLGTRLRPLTSITNKHLLPVYDRPMIYYPLQTLADAGIKDVMVVTGGNSAGSFMQLLGDGREFGFRSLNYAYQTGEGGIAQAIGLARAFIGGEKFIVILGDNILENSIAEHVESFNKQPSGARILYKRVDDPRDYGVAEIVNGKVVSIVEKPADPASDFAVIGVYMYDNCAFDIIDELKPSGRGELEVTDLNNAYIQRGEMQADEIGGWWSDCGASIDNLLEANNLAAEIRKGIR